jgi:hypothetical protein
MSEESSGKILSRKRPGVVQVGEVRKKRQELLVDPEPDLVRTPLLASVRKENESGFDVLYLDIYFVLPHKGAPAACQDNSTHC